MPSNKQAPYHKGCKPQKCRSCLPFMSIAGGSSYGNHWAPQDKPRSTLFLTLRVPYRKERGNAGGPHPGRARLWPGSGAGTLHSQLSGQNQPLISPPKTERPGRVTSAHSKGQRMTATPQAERGGPAENSKNLKTGLRKGRKQTQPGNSQW